MFSHCLKNLLFFILFFIFIFFIKIKNCFKYILKLFKIFTPIYYIMNSEFDSLINKLSTDITNSLKSNLSIYVKKNEQSNELLQQLKLLLFKLPEYVELQTNYNQLAQRYNELKDKHEPHILLDVSEVKTKSYESVNLSCDTLNSVKVIELNYLKNNVINKTLKAESDEEVSELKAKDDDDEEDDENDEEEEEAEDEEAEDEEAENEEAEDEEEEEEADNEEAEDEEADEEAEDDEEEEEADEEADEEEKTEVSISKQNDTESKEEPKEHEDDEATEDDGEELELVTIDKKKYYKNELNNDIYECLDDEEPGDLVGKLVNGKIHHI